MNDAIRQTIQDLKSNLQCLEYLIGYYEASGENPNPLSGSFEYFQATPVSTQAFAYPSCSQAFSATPQIPIAGSYNLYSPPYTQSYCSKNSITDSFQMNLNLPYGKTV